MKEEEGKNSVSAVIRTFSVLQAIAEHPDFGVSELAEVTGMPKATVFRFLQTLTDLGYIVKTPETDRYTLTMGLFLLGSSALESRNMIQTMHPLMEELNRRVGETVHLAIRDEGKIIYMHKVDSHHALRMSSSVGKTAPVHCTAMGKILMAGLSDHEMEQVLKGYSFTPYTPKTLCSRKEFLVEIEEVRKNGLARDLEEYELHVRCAAAPIRDYPGGTVAAISVSAPLFRHDEESFRKLESLVQETAKEASQLLGYQVVPKDSAGAPEF